MDKTMTIGDRVSATTDDLLMIVKANRPFGKAMIDKVNFHQDSVKFNNYKNTVKHVLSIASDLSTCYRDRKDDATTQTTTNLLSDAWKSLLKFFETEETGRIKPAQSDVITLLTLSNRTTTKKTQECKDAIKARNIARENYEENETDENQEILDKCEEALAAIEAKEWNSFKEYTDVSVATFRKGVEDLIADIADKRVRKTFAEREEARKAENKKKRKSGKK